MTQGNDAKRLRVIHSPALRKAVRGAHRSLMTVTKVARATGPRKVDEVDRKSQQATIADAISSMKEVDRVDVKLVRRLGSSTRVIVRAWVHGDDCGINPDELDPSWAGVAPADQARLALKAPAGWVARRSWNARPGGVGDDGSGSSESYQTAVALLDHVTEAAWRCAGACYPALEVMIVPVQIDRPWALGLEAIGGGAILTPDQARARYGEPL